MDQMSLGDVRILVAKLRREKLMDSNERLKEGESGEKKGSTVAIYGFVYWIITFFLFGKSKIKSENK